MPVSVSDGMTIALIVKVLHVKKKDFDLQGQTFELTLKSIHRDYHKYPAKTVALANIVRFDAIVKAILFQFYI